MKLNLEFGNTPRNGFKNISFGAAQEYDKSLTETLNEDSPIIMGDFHNLDQLIPDQSAEEIVFNPILNHLSPDELVQVLEHWNKKLIFGGILKLNFIDINIVATGIKRSDLDLQQIHVLTLGGRNQCRSVLEINTFKGVGEKLGYKVNLISPNDYLVNVELSKI